ncbi:2-keto-4-pentenoate hydratase/2-oxohepta-3-ene-1,7-dioic acid hydratase in catechol pathway [Bradyrhizobium sp. AZCC 1610]|uniref:fumarylacetoacetate hydrolase family protein n=1 Tax=Bradyrhizobium sp. AZCC 1610 TaxID=3117020 RepID=UPI002FF423DC
MHQYSLHANAASPSFYRNSHIFENIAYYENYCNQKSDTSFLIFSIPRLIDHASEIFDLMPSDVIAIGTPAGVGFTRKPPMFLAPGDVVEVEVEKIGVLRNPVVDEAAQ